MQLTAPGLSHRAEEHLKQGAESPLMGAIMKTFSNQWDAETNPNGIVNAGLAENSLMHDWLVKFFERQGTLKILHTDLTYGQSILGSDRLLSALSTTYSRYFNPHKPIENKHLVTSNGMSSMIEHLAACISDEGDEWLLPAPWYNGFVQDLNATSKVGIASVDIPDGQHGELGEVEALDAEMQRRKREGGKKITAVLVTNPHNPLGFCYKRDVLVEYARFAERWNLYLVSDEIYALSVFDSPDSSAPTEPFTSILALDVLKEAQCNPARVLQLWGMSKDFGANGFRGGCLVSQHNEKIMQALATTAMPMRMGSPTDILWSALLNSPDLSHYVEANQRALARAYTFVSAWLHGQKLPYRPAQSGHFLLVDFRELVRRLAKSSADSPSTDDEIKFLNQLVDHGVYLGPGFSYAVSTPGYFRITFSIRRKELEVGLERIEKMCSLPSLAKKLSKQHPQ